MLFRGGYSMSDPNFDSIKHLNPYNVEYWQERELMPLLGYGTKWQNFESVIKKAMVSCEKTGNIVADHFTDASKMIGTRYSAGKENSYQAMEAMERDRIP